jgi:hypothetical protein
MELLEAIVLFQLSLQRVEATVLEVLLVVELLQVVQGVQVAGLVVGIQVAVFLLVEQVMLVDILQ